MLRTPEEKGTKRCSGHLIMPKEREGGYKMFVEAFRLTLLAADGSWFGVKQQEQKQLVHP